jgi:hypothetical protein
MGTKKSTRGPKPDRLAIEGDWHAAVKKALSVERPPTGWPRVDKRAKKVARKRSGKRKPRTS